MNLMPNTASISDVGYRRIGAAILFASAVFMTCITAAVAEAIVHHYR